MDERTLIVAFQGSIEELVSALASALTTGLVVKVADATPCPSKTYQACPLAALVDQDHPSHTMALEEKRQRLLAG